jgi:hypothetical protein
MSQRYYIVHGREYYDDDDSTCCYHCDSPEEAIRQFRDEILRQPETTPGERSYIFAVWDCGTQEPKEVSGTIHS